VTVISSPVGTEVAEDDRGARSEAAGRRTADQAQPRGHPRYRAHPTRSLAIKRAEGPPEALSSECDVKAGDEEEPTATVGDRTVGSSRVMFFGSTTVSLGLAARHEGGQASELLYEARARASAVHTKAYIVSSTWRTPASKQGRCWKGFCYLNEGGPCS
jgi:hypothetical protein